MTLVSEIVEQGFRECNMLADGQSPNPTQSNGAVTRLQSLVLSALGNEIGFILEDWNVASSTSILKPSGFTQDAAGYTVKPQSRLMCNLTQATSLTLDPQPQDGQRVSVVDAKNNFSTFNLTLNGNGRLIEGGTSVVLNTDLTRKQWFYRSDRGEWIVISPLSTTSEMPTPEEFDDFWIISLAMRLSPRYGRTMSEESTARLSQQRDQMVAHYLQSRVRDAMQLQQPQEGTKA